MNGLCILCVTNHHEAQDHPIITEAKLSEMAQMLSSDIQVAESGSHLEMAIIAGHIRAALAFAYFGAGVENGDR